MVMFYMCRGDLFDNENAEVHCVTVNCIGAMGAGIAKKCRDKYPDIYQRYKAQCDKGLWKPGQCCFMTASNGDRLLLVATKDKWWDPSKTEWVEDILARIATTYEDYGYSSLALTHLGCGNGKLDKSDVRALMQKHLGDCMLDLYLY